MQWITNVLAKLEVLVNKFIELDPETAEALLALAGQKVLVNITGLEISVLLQVVENGISLSVAGADTDADVIITGPPLALLALLKSGGAIENVQNSEVRVDGNVHSAKLFSKLASDLDIDWEELLALRIGDMPAHQLGLLFERLTTWRSKVHENWQEALSEYLREEARVLPTRVEVNSFLDEIDTLRDGIERLSMRIELLNNQH